MNYNLILWGHLSNSVFKTQKRILRVISVSKYNAHTDPLFKQLNILKLEDMYSLAKYKFYYKIVKNRLPPFFLSLKPQRVSDSHNHNTRQSADFVIPRIKHKFASHTIRYSIPGNQSCP